MIRFIMLSFMALFLVACTPEKENIDDLIAQADAYLLDEDVFYTQIFRLTDDEKRYEKVYSNGDARYDNEDGFPNSAFVRGWSKELLRDRVKITHVDHNSTWFQHYWSIEEKDFDIFFNAVGDDVKYRLNYFKRH